MQKDFEIRSRFRFEPCTKFEIGPIAFGHDLKIADERGAPEKGAESGLELPRGPDLGGGEAGAD